MLPMAATGFPMLAATASRSRFHQVLYASSGGAEYRSINSGQLSRSEARRSEARPGDLGRVSEFLGF